MACWPRAAKAPREKQDERPSESQRPRGAALVFHPEIEVRALLAEALTRLSFEAIPLREVGDLGRFAKALSPSLVLLPPEAFEDPAVPELTRRRDLTVVALGQPAEEDEATSASQARARAVWLPLAGTSSAELASPARPGAAGAAGRSRGGRSGRPADRQHLAGALSRSGAAPGGRRLHWLADARQGVSGWPSPPAGCSPPAPARRAGSKPSCRLAQQLEGEIAVFPGKVELAGRPRPADRSAGAAGLLR